jgi:hypothetical protein
LNSPPTKSLLSPSAAARDFADVYVLARRFGKEVLLARAENRAPKNATFASCGDL